MENSLASLSADNGHPFDQPFLEINHGKLVLLFQVIFQLTFWSAGSMEKHRKAEAVQVSGSVFQRKQIPVICGGAVLILFLLSLIFVSGMEEELYQAAYGAEGLLQRAVKQAGHIQNDPSDGTVARGDLYPGGITQLELRSTQKPTETIYLRGLMGGTYENGEWQPADDTELFQRMEENSLHWERWSNWIPGMYETLYNTMNRNMQRSEALPERDLFVGNPQGRNKGNAYWYSPYYYGIRTAAPDGYGYTFTYYQRDEIDIDWENVTAQFGMNRDWYHEVEEAYLKEAKITYTEVPEEEVPRLVQLCKDNPLEKEEDITAFILYTLSHYASYSRTPGLFPLNEDPVEYFLFEKGEGYCQHFASAAVLMYRMYGIPARYVSGYAVSADDFQQDSASFYRAEVTDEDAHAWPEIFLEDKGWVPVEVTPSGENADYLDQERNEILQANGRNWNMNILEGQQGEREKEDRAAPSEEKGIEGEQETHFMEPVDVQTVLFVLCMIILAVNVWGFVHKICVWRNENRTACALFGKMMEALHFAKKLTDYDGTEKEFGICLSREMKSVTEGEAERFIRLVNQEAYGRIPLTRKEQEEGRSFYGQIMAELLKDLPWWKKFMFCFIYNYL
jgi:hypothetical protein